MAWFVVCFVALLYLRLQRFAHGGPYGLDASFYYQIARHVWRGDGLVTSVSLYFEGWKLPARTIAYPLWPLVLGLAGRAVGIARATEFLPPVLYLASLPLLFLQARFVERELLGDGIWPRWSPRLAHLLTLLFGVNVMYFSSTTHPYTEGLGFTIGLGALLLLRRPTVSAATAAGFLCALAFLARSQMIALAIGAFVALAVSSWRKLPRSHARLAGFMAAAALPVLVWVVYVGYIPGVTVIDGASRRVALPGFAQQVASSGAVDYLLKRLPGFAVAFDPFSSASYVQTFGPAAFLVPVAMLLWAVSARYRAAVALTESTLATTIAGAFAFFTLFLYRGDFFLPWLFGWRHGIPLIFLLVVIAPWMIRASGRWGSIAVVVVLCISIFTGLTAVRRFIASEDGPRYSRAEVQMLDWLGRQPKVPMLITTRAQTLSYGTDASIHWTICTAEPAMTKLMLERLPVDYVIVYADETRCPFAQDLAGVMRGDVMFGSGPDAIYVLARRSPPRS